MTLSMTQGTFPSLGSIAMVAAGGAAGCVARFMLGAAVAAWLPRQAGLFPVATLAANVIGCTLAGSLVAALATSHAEHVSHAARLTLMVGFLGGLTTFSAFAVESLELLDRSPALGLVCVALNVCLSLAGAWCGMTLTRALIG